MTVLLRDHDPAAALAPDPGSPAAQALLNRITAEPRTRAPRSRPVRLALVSGGLAAAATVAAVAATTNGTDRPRVSPAGFVVARHADGSVSATMRWSALADPQALQRALDAAGARTTVFVETDTGSPGCTVGGQSVPYSAAAVEWNGPDAADPDSGLVVHPDQFPADGTFVVVVWLAPSGPSGNSTLPPEFPQVTGSLSYMAVGTVVAPAC